MTERLKQGGAQPTRQVVDPVKAHDAHDRVLGSLLNVLKKLFLVMGNALYRH